MYSKQVPIQYTDAASRYSIQVQLQYTGADAVCRYIYSTQMQHAVYWYRYTVRAVITPALLYKCSAVQCSTVQCNTVHYTLYNKYN